MIIRTATVDDLAAIAAIQSGAPGAAQWDPAHYLLYDCLVGQVGNLRPVVNRPSELVRPLVGFLVSRQTAPSEREILNLAVDPAYRRQGIARALLQHALTETPSDWYLEVRESNAAAIRLYHSFGFQQIALRPAYYANPHESGIVMKLRS